eukprot:1204815-Rhodomonas_salina.1
MDEPRPDRDSTDDEDGSTLAFDWDTTAEYVDSDDERSGSQTPQAANGYQAWLTIHKVNHQLRNLTMLPAPTSRH